MFPIRDENPTSSTAYVTIGLIVLNSLIFLAETLGFVDERPFTYKYGFLPAELVRDSDVFERGLRRNPPVRQARDRLGRPLVNLFGRPLVEPDRKLMQAATAIPARVNIFTCMFLHGGWWHLLGNMLYLWIFGNNIEDKLGPVLFTVFYLGTGLVGNLAHTVFDPGYVPLIGASGAISGVMGAYVLLFPRARVLAVVPIYFYPLTISLPAWVFLGIYIVFQNLLPVWGGVADKTAYWAHIGGFLAGMALIYVFPHRKPPAGVFPVSRMDRDDADLII